MREAIEFKIQEANEPPDSPEEATVGKTQEVKPRSQPSTKLQPRSNRYASLRSKPEEPTYAIRGKPKK